MAQDAEKTWRCVIKFNGVVWYILAFEKKKKIQDVSFKSNP